MTRDEFNHALEEASKQWDWALDEWYEKFNNLHLKLSKRVKRESAKHPPQLQLDSNGVEQERPSVLKMRKLGSV